MTTRPRSPSRSMRGTSTSICRCSAPAAARWSRRASPASRDAVRAAANGPVADRRHRRAACSRRPGRRANRRRRWSTSRRAPDIVWVGAARRRRRRKRQRPPSRSICARPTRSRRTPRGCRADDRDDHAPVRARRAGAVGGERRATPRRIATLHAASFRHGWSDGEFERLLIERNVVAHRATAGPRAARLHPVAARRRRGGNPLGRGGVGAARARPCARAAQSAPAAARRPRRAAPCSSKSTRTTQPARRLYQRAGFREVGRRPGYYQQGRDQPRPRWCCAAIWSESAPVAAMDGPSARALMIRYSRGTS